MSWQSYMGLLVGFIIAYILITPEDHDDGDGPDKGIMSPVLDGA